MKASSFALTASLLILASNLAGYLLIRSYGYVPTGAAPLSVMVSTISLIGSCWLIYRPESGDRGQKDGYLFVTMLINLVFTFLHQVTVVTSMKPLSLIGLEPS